MKRLELYDTTLRDGCQSEDVNLVLEDKLRITEELDDLGIHVVEGDTRICKVSIVGIGMRSHVGIASKMFRALSEEGINIQMISTSEIKISCVVDEGRGEDAVRAIHKAFKLDQKP